MPRCVKCAKKACSSNAPAAARGHAIVHLRDRRCLSLAGKLMSILIVGGGKMGLSHLAILSGLIGHDRVAVCDPSKIARFIFKRFKIRTFASLDAALAAPVQWQGAIIATPTSSHFPIAKALLARGIACFIEKPLTLDVAKSEELAQLRRSKDGKVQLGLVLRFVAPFVKLREIVESGALGPVLGYQGHMLGNVITKAGNNWRSVYAQGGGCLNEYGPHLIDLCRYLFGDVDQLASASFGRTYSAQADDKIELAWTHASGAQGELLLDWCDPSKRKSALAFEVRFAHGVVRASNADISITMADDAPITAEARAALLAPVRPYQVNYYLRGEEYTLQLEAFLETALGSRHLLNDSLRGKVAASIDDGLAVDKLITAIAKKASLS
jgi:scyllo-inositol 2-dehydrogenase (NADP+)